MAETDAVEGAGSGLKGALGRKIGPLPLVVWLAAAGVIFWYVSRRKGGTGGQTDPAGNVGTINPATGYVAGSPQDLAAQQGGAFGGGGSSSGGGTTDGSTVGGNYPDNASWGRAAINYLVGLGVDPTQANEAIQQFLSGQQLTTEQQGLVNLAVQGLKAPPTPPSPTGVQAPPVVTPPAGTTYAANPPGSVTVSGTTSTSVTLTWGRVANATSYTVSYGTTQDATGGSTTVGADSPRAVIGGLQPATLYYFRVQGNPAKTGAPYATITGSTAATGGPGSNGGGTGTTGAEWSTHTTVHEGEHLDQLLGFFNMNQSEFEQHNPGITQYYRWYQTGKGYAPGNQKRPGDIIALNTGHDITVTVKQGGF